MSGELAGKVAVVTGASYGLGRAISADLAARGATVVLTDIDDRLEATAIALGCAARRMDVTDEAAVRAVADWVRDDCGGADILVNNAGYSRTIASVLEMDLAEWDRSLRINLTGTLHCLKAFGGVMVAQGRGGRVVNIASVAAFRPYRMKASYCVSKSAVVALTRAAALELAEHKITVNAVAPGQTETETTLLLQSDSRYGEGMRARAAAIPLGGMGQPADIAQAVAFFTHPANGHITGQTTIVDGGTLLA